MFPNEHVNFNAGVKPEPVTANSDEEPIRISIKSLPYTNVPMMQKKYIFLHPM